MLTQLRNGSIFEIQGEFRKVQKENKKSNDEIAKRIAKSLNLLCSEELEATIYRDQDGGKHLVFVKPGRKEDITLKRFFREMYSNTYLTGDICRNTSDLLCQKSCLRVSSNEEGFEDAEVSFITVMSLLKALTYFNEIAIMVKFQHWLHSITL